MKNLSKTGSVLILLTAGKEEMECAFRLTRYFISEGKSAMALCYDAKSKTKSIDNYQIPEIKIFNKHHLNWFYIPSHSFMTDTMEREFDLLIDISDGSAFALKYIHSLSLSALKSGSARGYMKECADMTIEIPEGKDTEYFISQLKHYLTRINQTENVS